MPALAFEPWGNYATALAAAAECLRVTPWTRPCSTPESLRLGIAASPEFSCLAFKACTGHFLEAAQAGVEYGVMVNSQGTCRLRYYRLLQQQLLAERGFNLFIFGLGYDGLKPPLVRHFDPTILDCLRSACRSRQKILAVDDLEVQAWARRAIELHPGETTRVMGECLRDLEQAQDVAAIKTVRRSIPERFRAIPAGTDRRPLKVGLLGEATLLRDRFLNHDLEENLGRLGVEVRNFFLLGAEIRNIFHLGLWSRHGRRALRQLARPWLDTPVGGHALASVAYTVRCAREGYDGVIHVAPAGCMPEVSVRPILRRIATELDFPLLECSFDEHTSQVGLITRLEAFVDILNERRGHREP